MLALGPFQVFDLPIYLFDCCRTQLHYVQNAQEFATYLVQVSRALAKMERRLANHDRLLVNVDKVMYTSLFCLINAD